MKIETLPLVAAILAGGASAFEFGGKPPPQPETTMADNFPWRDPFTANTTASYAAACEASGTFAATQYTLHDLFSAPPAGLLPWGDGLKLFFSGREYPGGWAGLDRHLHDRDLLMMGYADMPLRVRRWIEDRERAGGEDDGGEAGRGLFAVFDRPAAEGDKVTERVAFPEETPEEGEEGSGREFDRERVAIFAPGALYSILPLFVADGSDCQETLADLSNYSPTPKDAAVVSWPVSRTQPDVAHKKRDIEFTIKAQVLKLKEGAKEAVAGDSDEEAEAAKPSQQSKDEL